LDFPLPLTVALSALLLVPFVWWRVRVVRHINRRRMAGHRLMDCLKAYSAWVDWQRDEPLMHQHPGDVGIPPPLAQACQLKDQWLPELAPLMLKLLESHRELMQFLWEENILRMTHTTQRPYYADPRYHQLRDMQDAALDGLFMRCRKLIGDTETNWQRTRSDFSFSSGLSTPG
jgi:hypothetical protein